VRRLMRLFTYVDAMVVDTPIVDPRVREAIHDIWRLDERLKRCTEFRRYLDAAWIHLSEAEPSLEWPETSRALERDIERIVLRTS
jgi:hypothetical protein